MAQISENIAFIRNEVESLKKCRENVKIIAVTKTFPCQDILLALDSAITDIGESKVQEALPKFEQLGSSLYGITKHFIGHLQSNKAKKAVQNFDLIQSLDSLSLAKDISRHAAEIGKIQNCLIEVKVSHEEAKTGIKPDQARDFYSQCMAIPNLLIKGLMAITPLSCNPEDSRPYFKQIYKLFENLKSDAGSGFEILSMGMSDDYKIAVEEGSNMVRIGSAIFGNRDYDSK